MIRTRDFDEQGGHREPARGEGAAGPLAPGKLGPFSESSEHRMGKCVGRRQEMIR